MKGSKVAVYADLVPNPDHSWTRRLSGFATFVVVASLVSGCSTASQKTAQPPKSAAGAQTTPTPKQQAAALKATNSYRHQIVTAAGNVAADAQLVVRDAARGDLGQAKLDALHLQEAYDTLRPAIAEGSATDLSFDGRLSDQPRWIGRKGIHAIETDLAAGDLAAAGRDATWVASQGAALVIGLFRTIYTPQQIAQRTVANLSWAVEQVIDRPQEVASHLNLADLSATTNAASVAINALVPLGLLVDPTTTYLVQDRLKSLQRLVASSGDPTTTTDQAVTTATWKTLAQSIDALASALGILGGAMGGYGSGRSYA